MFFVRRGTDIASRRSKPHARTGRAIALPRISRDLPIVSCTHNNGYSQTLCRRLLCVARCQSHPCQAEDDMRSAWDSTRPIPASRDRRRMIIRAAVRGWTADFGDTVVSPGNNRPPPYIGHQTSCHLADVTASLDEIESRAHLDDAVGRQAQVCGRVEFVLAQPAKQA